MKKIIFGALIFSGIFLNSCSDSDLEPTLSTNKPSTEIKTLNDLKGLLGGAYDRMTSETYYGRNVVVFGDVRSDNTYANANSGRFATSGSMDMINSNGDADAAFLQMYRVIASCNIIINSNIAVDANIVGHAAAINYVKGQALALRALAHYDLVRIFGQQHVGVGGGDMNSLGVAYVKQFLNDNEMKPKRSSVGEVKAFIYADLNKALEIMDKTLDKGGKKSIRTVAVNAIKARVALYFGDWSIAKAASNEVMISGAARVLTATEFPESYKVNEQANSIFELIFLTDDNRGNDSLYNIYNNTAYGDIVVLQDLKNQFSATDVRGTMITLQEKSRLRNTGKFVKHDIDVVLFRFEEMVLINAEASFRLDPTDASALTNLNKVATNRGDVGYTSVSIPNILLERRKELCFEGFRFDDIARTKMDMPVVDAVKQTYDDIGLPGIAYGSYRFAFPIPLREKNANSNTIQNLGY